MFDHLHLAPGRARLLLLGLPVVVAAALVAAALLYSPGPAPGAAVMPPPAAQAGNLPSTGGLLVEVTGAVVNPGLYRLQKGQRVDAAIAAAGGLTAAADPARLPNMAKRLTDGMQVTVPEVGGSGSASSSGTTAVDLNTATADELANVPGFTAGLAAEAVRYRQQYGGLSSTRELVDVLNMSPADYIIARKYLRV